MELEGWDQVDRKSDEYRLCLIGITAIGVAAGLAAAGPTAPMTLGTSLAVLPVEGAALGMAAGYLLCPALVPRIRQKIQDSLPLSQAEVREAATAMGVHAGVRRAADAVRLLATVREQQAVRSC